MYPREDGSGLELRDYLRILRRRKLAVIATPLLAVVAALLFTNSQTPVYASTAELLFQVGSAETLFDNNTGVHVDPDRRLRNEIRILKSRPVRDAVRERLGSSPGISATPVEETDVITLRAVNARPEVAARIVDAYAEAYIEVRQEQAIDELLSASQKVQEKVADLQRQIDAAPEPQKQELIKVQFVFREELERVQVNSDLRTPRAQLVTPASIPTEPFSPKPVRTGLAALSFGLVIGIAIAFLFEHFDDTVRTKDDLEKSSPGLPVLGLIPVVPGWKPKDAPQTVTLTSPTSPAAEAYRTLRTAVQFLGVDKPVQTIQVTSAGAHEGKTTTLANLAVALARAGQRVVVICCDLRRPRIHEFFGLSNSTGFTSVLLGEVPLSGAFQKVPKVERLLLMASGPVPPNPSELLSSRRVGEMLAPLKAEGYIVLIDSPPVLPVTDALVLSKWADATLVVGSAKVTSRRDIARALELLRQVDAPLVGTVLNGVTPELGQTYGYSDYYSSTNGSAGPSSKDGRLGNRRRDRKDRKAYAKSLK